MYSLQSQQFLGEAAELIQKIRKYSLDVVHKIAEWRSYFLHLYTMISMNKQSPNKSQLQSVNEIDHN